MTDFSELQPFERAKRYAELADNARRRADQSSGETRQTWLLIGELWRQLAGATGAALPSRESFDRRS